MRIFSCALLPVIVLSFVLSLVLLFLRLLRAPSVLTLALPGRCLPSRRFFIGWFGVTSFPLLRGRSHSAGVHGNRIVTNVPFLLYLAFAPVAGRVTSNPELNIVTKYRRKKKVLSFP